MYTVYDSSDAFWFATDSIDVIALSKATRGSADRDIAVLTTRIEAANADGITELYIGDERQNRVVWGN